MLDKVFIRILKKLYPQLDITVVVRGFPTLNDATYEDAEDIGFRDNQIYEFIKGKNNIINFQNIDRDITIKVFEDYKNNCNKINY